MVRVGLTFCLVVVTAAGPWFCCCASDRLAARARALVGGVAHSHAKCGCADRFGTRPPDDRGGRPCPPLPDVCGCVRDAPAKGDSSAAEWTDSARFAHDAAGGAAGNPAATAIGPLHFAAPNGERWRVASAFPRLSARAILSAIQHFRC